MVPLAPVDNLRHRCGITWLTVSLDDGTRRVTHFMAQRFGIAGNMSSSKEGFSFILTHGNTFALSIFLQQHTMLHDDSRLQLDVGYKGRKVGLLGRYARGSWDSDELR